MFFAGNDYYHYHIKPSLEGRSSFFTAGTKFEGLNDSPGGVRVRRYVPDPIAQLADNYPADKKTKFFVSPDGGSVQSHPHEQPVDNRKPGQFVVCAAHMYVCDIFCLCSVIHTVYVCM